MFNKSTKPSGLSRLKTHIIFLIGVYHTTNALAQRTRTVRRLFATKRTKRQRTRRRLHGGRAPKRVIWLSASPPPAIRAGQTTAVVWMWKPGYEVPREQEGFVARVFSRGVSPAGEIGVAMKGGEKVGAKGRTNGWMRRVMRRKKDVVVDIKEKTDGLMDAMSKLTMTTSETRRESIRQQKFRRRVHFWSI
ncbi:hypothetical protein BT63DRAFT_208045 [Microthyrium microscopicum]|uniref:Uncharacterized protein n=1 Tax=Microthyrium microscopicum TaxID=703497 RepID=A0A6A6UFL9_9PEZI|nr:hypothetical protein BT63DRAFT_208045 [Microthyrium microscopicum]